MTRSSSSVGNGKWGRCHCSAASSHSKSRAFSSTHNVSRVQISTVFCYETYSSETPRLLYGSTTRFSVNKLKFWMKTQFFIVCATRVKIDYNQKTIAQLLNTASKIKLSRNKRPSINYLSKKWEVLQRGMLAISNWGSTRRNTNANEGRLLRFRANEFLKWIVTKYR